MQLEQYHRNPKNMQNIQNSFEICLAYLCSGCAGKKDRAKTAVSDPFYDIILTAVHIMMGLENSQI